MNNNKYQGVVALLVGGLLFIVSIIASALFAEKILYGEYIFSTTLFSGLILMLIGIKKAMQNIVSKR
jgi:UDP-N-acetylmuramyl pentapeptide phosphotransferase/UDP-N-acetylglucosamine-1-phosphate transferase